MHTLLISSLYLLGAALVLFWGADCFVRAAIAVGARLGWSSVLVGVVIVGWATAIPEVMVSAVSAWHGNADLAIGNALGSYITNMSLVIGVSCLIRPLRISARLVSHEFVFLSGALLLAYCLMRDAHLSRIDGVILLVAMGLSSYFLYGLKSVDITAIDDRQSKARKPPGEQVTWLTIGVRFGIGLVLLLVSSEVIVRSALSLASYMGVSNLWIGLTVVAIGTSLPELAASGFAALHNEPDIALGNALGSNIFGLLAVLAMPGLLAPGPVAHIILHRDFPVMGFITFLFATLVFIKSYRRNSYCIGRCAGVVLLVSFMLYLWLSYAKNN